MTGSLAATEPELPTVAKNVEAIDGKHLWSTMLTEAACKTAGKLPGNRTLVILGNNLCGKTTMIARLKGVEELKKSYGLEYTFIDVKDEAREDQTKLNAWILDGDLTYSHLLKFALPSASMQEEEATIGSLPLAVITVSMAEPWSIVESLQQWSRLLSKHIERLGLTVERLSECRAEVVRYFHAYTEPSDTPIVGASDSARSAVPPINASAGQPAAAVATPTSPRLSGLHPATAALLRVAPEVKPSAAADPGADADGDGTNPESPTHSSTDIAPLALSNAGADNFGIPIVVVVTKTDLMDILEKSEHYTEEHFDFVQMYIRRFCLQYGAALVYVSVKEDKNCNLLNRYLQSRIYGFHFNQPANVVDRNAIFIPAGWDSEKKIDILAENMTTLRPDSEYNAIIPRPAPHKTATSREEEFKALDDQAFLHRLAKSLQTSAELPSTGANQQEAAQQQSPLQRHSPRVASAGKNRSAVAGPHGTPVGPSAGASGVGTNANMSENMLATFFNNLLTKKTPTALASRGQSPADASSSPNAPRTVPPAVEKCDLSTDEIQVELERLARQRSPKADGAMQSPSPPEDASASPKPPSSTDSPAE